MGLQLSVGTRVHNQYEVTEILRENSLYQWLAAKHLHNSELVTLQVLMLETQVKSLVEYFDKLKMISRKGLWVPQEILTDNNFPLLVVVYPPLPERSLKDALIENPDRAIHYWEQVSSKLLHALHQQKLIHGFVSFESLAIAADDTVYLTNFGYAPLLELGEQKAIDHCGDFLANETRQNPGGATVTSAIDVSAFAKTVGLWNPKLQNTPWYQEATHPDPLQRPKIRDVFKQLKPFLEETSVPNSSPPPTSRSVPIPKHTLTLEAKPPAGGKLQGDGSYPEGDRVNVTVSDHSGWRFTHWSGDQTGGERSLYVVMDGNKTIVAHFQDLSELVPGAEIPSTPGSSSGSTTSGQPQPPTSPEANVPIEYPTSKGSIFGLLKGQGRIILFTVLATLLTIGGIGTATYFVITRLEPFCRSGGTCPAFEQQVAEAETAGKDANEKLKSKNIQDLQSARDRLATAIGTLKNIPSNAKVYPVVQKTLPTYQQQLIKLDARLKQVKAPPPIPPVKPPIVKTPQPSEPPQLGKPTPDSSNPPPRGEDVPQPTYNPVPRDNRPRETPSSSGSQPSPSSAPLRPEPLWPSGAPSPEPQPEEPLWPSSAPSPAPDKEPLW